MLAVLAADEPDLRLVPAWRIAAGRAAVETGLAAEATLTRPRHRAALTEAAAWLAELDTAPLPELRAEALRAALRAIGRITGRVGVEAVLDAVFGEFCIGK